MECKNNIQSLQYKLQEKKNASRFAWPRILNHLESFCSSEQVNFGPNAIELLWPHAEHKNPSDAASADVFCRH